MLRTEARAAASHNRMRVGVRIDRLVSPHAEQKLGAHRCTIGAPHEIREQIAEPLLDVGPGEKHMRQPVQCAVSFAICGVSGLIPEPTAAR